MITIQGPFGDFRTELIDILDIVIDRGRATRLVTDAENYIRAQARAGAESAIPTIEAKVRTAAKAAVVDQVPMIKAEVRKTVAPLVIGTAAVSATALVMAFLSWRSARRRP